MDCASKSYYIVVEPWQEYGVVTFTVLSFLQGSTVCSLFLLRLLCRSCDGLVTQRHQQYKLFVDTSESFAFAISMGVSATDLDAVIGKLGTFLAGLIAKIYLFDAVYGANRCSSL